MALIQKTYTFVANTRALAAQVNQNFDDVIGWIASDHHNTALYSNAVPITVSGLAPGIILTQSGMINQHALQRISDPGIIDPNAVPSVSTTFGDGSDGNVTISSPTTLTRDMYYNNLTVNSTLTTNGYRIYCQGTLAGSGTITWGTGNSGTAGTNSVAGNVPGTGGAGGAQTGSSGYFKNVAGLVGGDGSTSGTNGNGHAASSGSHCICGNGANGGDGGSTGGGGGTGGGFAGGTGGTATGVVQRFGIYKFLTFACLDLDLSGVMTQITTVLGSGSGGGGSYSAGGSAGGGGGSGASGGAVWIAARVWAGTFTIASIGGNGGNGGAGTSPNYPGGGGGGGGNGGDSIVIYNQKTWTGAYTLTGGTGGTGGGHGGTGNSGANGSNGNAGTAHEILVSNLI